MPVRYLQTLGAVAGISQWVNAVEITCDKPLPVTIQAAGRPGLSLSASKPIPFTLTTGGKPGLTLTASKPAPYEITVRPTLTTRR